MKHSDTAMGKAMTIAIHICTRGGEHENEEGYGHEGTESKDMESTEHTGPKGKRPKNAPKLPKGWHYMPDGTVMGDNEHEGMDE